MSSTDRGIAMTAVRPHKNSSQRETFEMPDLTADQHHRHFPQSTTQETYQPHAPPAEKSLDDRGTCTKRRRLHLPTFPVRLQVKIKELVV